MELAKVHGLFHVSMLRRYRSDPSHILPFQDIKIQEDFTFDEEPNAILDREIKQLWNKQVCLVKVLWQHHGMEEATWDPESIMRVQYPQLTEQASLSSKGSMATSRYGRSNMGTRIDNEGAVPSALQFR